MALNGFTTKVISRSSGSSAVAAAAYRHGAKMSIEHDGRVADYSRKEAVHSGGIELPEKAPQWAVDRYGGELTQGSANLWNDIEGKEATTSRHATAQLAREYLVLLPKELSDAENEGIIRGYVKEHIASRGMIADWSFHNVEGNPHVHIMATMRHLEEDGFGLKAREWNSRDVVNDLRREWAASVNLGLEKAGLDVRVDHRSFKEQGLEIEPSIHLGPEATNYQDKDFQLEKLKEMAAIQERNAAFLAENPEYYLRLVTAQRAVFTEDDLAREIHKRVGDADFTPLFEKLRNSDELVTIGERRWGPGKDDQKPLLTTRSQLAMEQGLLDRAGAMARDIAPGGAAFPEHEIKNEMLSEEQRLAVNAMVAPNRLSVVTGYAGAGKSSAVDEAKRIWEDRGYEVYGTALSGKAVDELAKSSGIEGRTIAAWEARMQADSFTRSDKFVMVMDEAGMVGSRQMDRFMRRVDAAGGKLILIGDAQQLQPISSGAALRAIAGRVGDATISTIRRQYDEQHREIAKAMATSAPRAEAALRLLDERGEISTFDGVGEAIATLAEDYVGNAEQSVSQVALAYTNADVGALNGAIREAMIEAGHVADDGIEINTVRGQRLVASGERIMTATSLPGHGISKGAFGTVEAVVNHEAQIRMDASGELVTFKADDMRALDHAYAVTVHKSQGATVDRSYVLPHELMDRQIAYVALTRHRSAVHIYSPSDRFETADDLAQTLSRTKLQTFSAREDVERAAYPGFGIDARLPMEARRDIIQVGPRAAEANVFTDPHLHEVSERAMGLMALPGGALSGSAAPEEGGGLGNVKAVVPDRDGVKMPLLEPSVYIDNAVAQSSVFSAEDISEAVMADAPDPETYLRTFSEAMSDARLVTLAEIGPGQVERLYSTTERIRQEIEMTDRAVDLAGKRFSGISISSVERHVRALERTLSDEQRTAVLNAMSAGSIAAVTGVAGAGKSYTMGAIREVAEAQGFTVVGAALAGKAADELEQGSDIQSRTLASWFHQFDQGRGLDPKTVIIVDEAGMVDGAHMNRILEQVEQDKAKLILVGDPEQLPPIGPIGAYRGIIERIGHSELTEVRRQRDPAMARATLALSRGGDESGKALFAYDEAGRIHHLGSRDAGIEAAAAQYGRLGDKDKVILTHRRADVDALNQAVIARMGAERSGVSFEAEGRPIEVANGDRILLTKNDRQLGVKNGMVGTVTSVDQDGFTLRIGAGGAAARASDQQEVRIDAEAYSSFTHGFATTIHKSQGMSVDHAIVYADRGMNKHLSYVAFSRHRDDMQIFTPFEQKRGLRELQEMAAKVAHQALALDHIADASKSFEEVIGKAATDDLARDLKYSDVRAAMIAARQDPVQEERTQARHLTRTSNGIVSGLADMFLRGGMGVLLQGDGHTTAMMSLFNRASRIIDQTQMTAQAVGAAARNVKPDPVQDAVNEQMTRFKTDITTRMAQAEMNMGKRLNAARHADLSREVDWLMRPAKLTKEQDQAARTLASALRRQEDIAQSAIRALKDDGLDVDVISQEHRRIAFDLAQDRLGAMSEPTLLDQRMADRMVEALGAKIERKGVPVDHLDYDPIAGRQVAERLEQLRRSLYDQGRFVKLTDPAQIKAIMSEEQIAALFKTDPLRDREALRIRVLLGEPKAVREAFPKLTVRQSEAVAQRMVENGPLAKDPSAYYSNEAVQRRLSQRMGLPVRVGEMTPEQAHKALDMLRLKHGDAGLASLLRTGQIGYKGTFNIQAPYGPAKPVQSLMKQLGTKATQHKRIAKFIAHILAPGAARQLVQ